jgi:hypothetical protein
MPIQVFSGDISQTVTLHGYGVVRVETIGRDVIQVRVLPARVARVLDVIPQSVRKRQTRIVIFTQTRNVRRKLIVRFSTC